MLCWTNIDAEGKPNPYTVHQGKPVIAGTKYIITKWFRERPWNSPLPAPAPVATPAVDSSVRAMRALKGRR
jgi:prolyl 4-hydroxylase